MGRAFFSVVLLALFSCQENSRFEGHPIYKSIASDSALYYYELGWKQIMDEGNYGLAEISYRQSLEHDPDFLIGKAVLGRLTLDLGERLQIQKELEVDKEAITGDERLVLEVYAALVEFTNAREQGSADTKKLLQKAFRSAEEHLGELARKYPDEVYIKAEYIEFLHARYGPRNALDSLKVLTTEAQRENPFLLGFSASMQAEMDNFVTALEQARRLKEIIKDTTIPKPYAVLGDVYFQMDSLQLAKENVAIAYRLDPRNLDVSRLKEKIDQKISGRE